MEHIDLFRGAFKCTALRIAEGDGTILSPVRIVLYFIDDDGKLICRYDASKEESGK